MALISYTESQKILQNVCESLQPSSEKIDVRNANGRILFRAVHSKCSNPAEPLAAMDGIAVRSGDIQQIPFILQHDQWQRINTGEPLGPEWDTVIRIEDVDWENDHPVIRKNVDRFQNVRARSEDFDKDQLLLSGQHQLEPSDLALLLASGHDIVEVYKTPLITIVITGSELVTSRSKKSSGRTIESNSAMIGSMIETWGGRFEIVGPVADDPDALENALRKCMPESDIVVVSAGTSKGTRDLTASVLSSLGTIQFHGIAINPAKPTLLARIGDVPVLGIPGYSVAAYIASLLFLQPLVSALSGTQDQRKREIYICAEELPPKESDVFHRVQIFDVDGRAYVRRIQRGASSLFSLAEMDGLMHVPPNTAIHKRDAVRIDVIRNRALNTIMLRGTFDPAIQKLSDLFHNQCPEYRILYSECEDEEALQNIVERNCHLAAISTYHEHDLFPDFARQLQDNMHRYRVFSSRTGLITSASMPLNSLDDLAAEIKVVIPYRLRNLWEKFVDANSFKNTQFVKWIVQSDEELIVRALESDPGLFAFINLRFLKSSRQVIAEIVQHLDLIVSESYLNQLPIKKLIEIMLSSEYGEWLMTHRGIDTSSRSLLQETYDLL